MTLKKSRLGKTLSVQGSVRLGCIDRILLKSKACPLSGCWLWTGTMSGAYGVIKVRSLESRNIRAHRLAYATFNGPVPEKLLVRHKCDVPRCVNPNHLELGTEADNMDDKQARGRGGCTGPKPKAVDLKVLRMLLDLGYAKLRIARMFGVSNTVIRNRVKGVGV